MEQEHGDSSNIGIIAGVVGGVGGMFILLVFVGWLAGYGFLGYGRSRPIPAQRRRRQRNRPAEEIF